MASDSWPSALPADPALADKTMQQEFSADATDIIHELSGGKPPKENIKVNVVHAVDGGWNFNGRAMTNAEMGAEIAQG